MKHYIEANRPGLTLSFELQRHIEVLGTAAISHAKMAGTLKTPKSRNPMLLCSLLLCPMFLFVFVTLSFRCDVAVAVKAIPACDDDKYRDSSALIYQVYVLSCVYLAL